MPDDTLYPYAPLFLAPTITTLYLVLEGDNNSSFTMRLSLLRLLHLRSPSTERVETCIDSRDANGVHASRGFPVLERLEADRCDIGFCIKLIDLMLETPLRFLDLGASKTHLALSCPDTVRLICEEMRKLDRTTLVALCLTSRDFQELALDNIWYELGGHERLGPLVRCMPEDLWKEEDVGTRETTTL
ncbi:hypothetical protein AX17_006044, partial [Amanita inopinata Kibby_2008]